MKSVFLGGLGSNRYHAYDLKNALTQDLLILELPGHGLNFHIQSPDLPALTDWFGKAIAAYEEVLLIAHSMGANLAPYLACQYPQIKKLVLLDGGYFKLEQVISLEEELTNTQTYLEKTLIPDLDDLVSSEKENSIFWSHHQEQALRQSFIQTEEGFRLATNHETVFNLLRLQRQAQGWLDKMTCPALLIPQTDDCPDWKQEMLKQVPDNTIIYRDLTCGHCPHIEKPLAIAQIIEHFLTN